MTESDTGGMPRAGAKPGRPPGSRGRATEWRVDLFVEKVAAGEGRIEAVLSSGWKQTRKSAGETARRLLLRADVCERIERRRAEMAEATRRARD